MTDQQPEALRLAEMLLSGVAMIPEIDLPEAAAELRRLHAENEALKREISATQPEDQGMGFIVKWQDGAGLMWDVYSFGKWLCRVVSPVNWDAYSVHAQLVQSGYAEHIDVRQLSAQNATKPAAHGMDETAAAKALCKHAAKITNVNFDDYWLIHSEEFKEEVRIVLEAAQAKQEEK